MTLVKVTVIHKVNRKAITVQNREAEAWSPLYWPFFIGWA